MKFGGMSGDVSRSLFKRPVTEHYPFERRETPVRLRGLLVWEDENCTGCSLCAKDCPANALDVIIIDRKAKQFVMRYNVDACTFCAQCVASCRRDCLEMDHTQWELAAFSRDGYQLMYGEPELIEHVLAEESQPDVEPVDG